MDAQLTTTLAMIAAFAAAMSGWAFFKARQFDDKYAASYRKAAVRASRGRGGSVLPSAGLVVIKEAGAKPVVRKAVRKKASRAG